MTLQPVACPVLLIAMVLQLSDLVNHYPIRCSISEYLTMRELRAIACTSKDNYDHIVGSRPEIFANLNKHTICGGNSTGLHRVPFKEEVGALRIDHRSPCLGRVRTFCGGCGATVCTNCCCNTRSYAILHRGRYGWVLPCRDADMTAQCCEYFYHVSAEGRVQTLGSRRNPNHSEDQSKDHMCPRCFVKEIRLRFRSKSLPIQTGFLL